MRENIVMPGEGYFWAVHLFHAHHPKTEEATAVILETGADFFNTALTQLPAEAEDFKAYAKAVGEAAGVKGKSLFMPLRAALTGHTHGPEMAAVFRLLGIERVRKRLEIAANL